MYKLVNYLATKLDLTSLQIEGLDRSREIVSLGDEFDPRDGIVADTLCEFQDTSLADEAVFYEIQVGPARWIRHTSLIRPTDAHILPTG
ncbi:hypothetical protein T265_08356 [Opisthorchis viverrini]|uniref:Uncharacterized protein n=1 Tax=Opisthorchis viverrini TaxID=6198 RepID=A0A074Z9Q9_OPIVI|nr:hypothetical protein T265_08356 [Opisthorchis viverrini]KER23853.1 hypothetical protein T265_08356 [Opisthorchis viverrini]